MVIFSKNWKIAQRLLAWPPNPRLPNTLELHQFAQHAAQLRPNRNVWTFVSSPLSPLCKILVANKVAVARFYLTRSSQWISGYCPSSLTENRIAYCISTHIRDAEELIFPEAFASEKFDVLRGRLLGNHNDFHWQLGGQINHQPCSCKAARVIMCTELDNAVSSF